MRLMSMRICRWISSRPEAGQQLRLKDLASGTLLAKLQVPRDRASRPAPSFTLTVDAWPQTHPPADFIALVLITAVVSLRQAEQLANDRARQKKRQWRLLCCCLLCLPGLALAQYMPADAEYDDLDWEDMRARQDARRSRRKAKDWRSRAAVPANACAAAAAA